MADVDALKIDLEYLKDLTKKMVKIPSPPGEEKNIGLFITAELKKMGIASQLQKVEKDRQNVLAKVKGRTVNTILFQGHMDTIPAYGWKEAFQPREKDGRIYGRGSADMKSSIACVLAAM